MEKQWTVYILECGDGTLYTGITDDLERRLKAHAEGRGAKYTRGRAPLKLRYREAAPDKSAALKREYAIKQMTRWENFGFFRTPSFQDWPSSIIRSLTLSSIFSTLSSICVRLIMSSIWI